MILSSGPFCGQTVPPYFSYALKKAIRTTYKKKYTKFNTTIVQKNNKRKLFHTVFFNIQNKFILLRSCIEYKIGRRKQNIQRIKMRSIINRILRKTNEEYENISCIKRKNEK
jgi:hypothetical protein